MCLMYHADCKLSFNHSIGRTHSWRFSIFYKKLSFNHTSVVLTADVNRYFYKIKNSWNLGVGALSLRMQFSRWSTRRIAVSITRASDGAWSEAVMTTARRWRPRRLDKRQIREDASVKAGHRPTAAGWGTISGACWLVFVSCACFVDRKNMLCSFALPRRFACWPSAALSSVRYLLDVCANLRISCRTI